MNVAILMGRLTDNPELRHTANDTPVCSFSIAVDRRSRSEDRQADFINIVTWRQTAEFVSKYFTKGQRIAVEGSIQTRKYQDKDGNNRTAFEVVANNVHFADSKREGAASGGTAEAPAGETASFSNTGSGDFTEITGDDDLPF